MNQIITSAIKIVILEIFFIHLPTTFRYLFDQAPEFFCQTIFFIWQCLLLQILFFGSAFIIVYYIYNFHAKNITAIQDEFWICFLNIWTLGFSAIANFVIIQISNNRPRYFYFCVGKISKKLQSKSHFINYIFDSIFLLALIAFLFVGIKFTIKKYQQKAKKTSVVKQVGHYFKEIKKANLFSLLLCAVALISISLLFILPFYQIENSDWDSLRTFPGYLWVYMFQLYTPIIRNYLVIPFIYGRNKYLCNFAKRVVEEKLTILFGSFHKCPNLSPFPNTFKEMITRKPK